jgi:hypothetical protein
MTTQVAYHAKNSESGLGLKSRRPARHSSPRDSGWRLAVKSPTAGRRTLGQGWTWHERAVPSLPTHLPGSLQVIISLQPQRRAARRQAGMSNPSQYKPYSCGILNWPPCGQLVFEMGQDRLETSHLVACSDVAHGAHGNKLQVPSRNLMNSHTVNKCKWAKGITRKLSIG